MKKKIIAVLMIMFVFVSGLFAYQLSPLSATFDAKGRNSSKVYTVTNDSEAPIAIQFKAMKRILNPDGSESMQDGSQFFSIQPNKVIINPGDSALIRVQYRGPQPTRELSFRIVSEQIALPVSANDPHANDMISFLFVYSTSAYVSPTKVIERVTASAKNLSDGRLEVRIDNIGSVHQILSGLTVDVKGTKGSYRFTADEVEKFDGVNLLSGSSLVMTSAEPVELGTDLRAKVTYDVQNE